MVNQNYIIITKNGYNIKDINQVFSKYKTNIQTNKNLGDMC